MSVSPPLWSWGAVDARAAEGALCLEHRGNAARLWVRDGRLIPGSGYARGDQSTRRQLARVGAIVRLRERGRYLIHAAGVVDPAGRAWILSGDSGSGKSTLAYALARAGWTVLGDDGVVVDFGSSGVTAHAWRDALRVSTKLADSFPELADEAAHGELPDARSRVPMTTAPASRAPLGSIVFVRRAGRAASRRMAPTEAMAALVRQSPWVIIPDAHTRRHVDALARLAQLPCFALDHTPAELHSMPAALANLA